MMKDICIRKKVKSTKQKRIAPADVFKYKDGRWECITVNSNSTENPVLVIRKKMTRIVMIIELRLLNGICCFDFKEVSPDGIRCWSDICANSEINITGGNFTISDEIEETVSVPIEVGDTFNHKWDVKYIVKFIADDGSLIAWDEERKKSIFVNRNDRDQLKAYGMTLN
ncbi:hypothetical protein [Aeromonas phage SW69-9]|nr:hypothetical protein [Aeromonas phage SW69-9]